MVVELVVKSGSLKDLAAEYGVSYPTIRLRVDRLIERLQAAMAGRAPDPLTDHLAGLVEQGQISASQAREIREIARMEAERLSKAAGGRAVQPATGDVPA